MLLWKLAFRLTAWIIFQGAFFTCFGQTDTTTKLPLDSVIHRQKGIIGQLAQNLLVDTTPRNQELVRNDLPFRRYSGKIIRRIRIRPLQFGVPINDTSQRIDHKLKRLADKFHTDSRPFVIANHLFFSENDKLSPFLLGDNVKHLRDLSFILDAQIRVIPVRGSPDSVDILVLTKDVLSLGASFRLHNSKSASLAIEEDNLLGWGDHLQVQGLYDTKRSEKYGYGFYFLKRNILGSFINVEGGYLNYNKTFSSEKKEEQVVYLRLTRPLVNRYMKWTYGTEVELHKTFNYYNTDSLYQQDLKYKYHLVDAWGAWNIDADKVNEARTYDRIRRLVSLRVIQKNFSDRALKYSDFYDYRFTDRRAVLGSFSLFKQLFFQTRYVYGFGRNEDVPEGGEASVTGGWTKINGRERPYAGFSFQRYYFTSSHHYFNFSVMSGAYLHKDKIEDITVTGRLDYFSHLHQWQRNWRHRYFFDISATRQMNTVLNEPLVLESEFGLPDFKNNRLGADYRLTAKGESVFYSPWSVLFFRFAPFVFANSTLMNARADSLPGTTLYSEIGGGVRIRNESLIFGTTEFRAMYLPQKNFRNQSWRIEVSTNIRFKYNQEFIRKPEFVRIN